MAVRDCVRANQIRWRRHAETRSGQRGIDKSMARECLLIGYFSERPVVPNRGGEIEYKFTMRAKVDGEQVEIAASLVPDSHVVVITVIDPN